MSMTENSFFFWLFSVCYSLLDVALVYGDSCIKKQEILKVKIKIFWFRTSSSSLRIVCGMDDLGQTEEPWNNKGLHKFIIKICI